MEYIVFPDLTTFAFSVLVVLALATPYLGWRLAGRRLSRAQPSVVA